MASDHLVHVIDDDEAVRDSLAFLLDTAGLKVRTYESAVTFLSQISEAQTGCIITDVRMPAMSGMELLQRIRERALKLPVVVITGHGDIPLAVEAMKLGAIDFIEKPFDDEALISVVRKALDRHRQVEAEGAKQAEIRQRLAALSPRERQVLEGLVAGHANKVIAFNLGISPRTVEVYRANLMTKIGAASLSDLVRVAVIAGLAAPGQGG